MKKTNILHDPFLHGTVIDIFGYIAALIVLVISGFFKQYPFPSLVFSSALLCFVLVRAIYTSVTISLHSHIRLLRIIVFNTNVDIKITKLYIKFIGERNLYRERIRLLIAKKKRAKKAYKNTVSLLEMMREEGYGGEMLLFAMKMMILIHYEAKKLSKKYRKKSLKTVDKNS